MYYVFLMNRKFVSSFAGCLWVGLMTLRPIKQESRPIVKFLKYMVIHLKKKKYIYIKYKYKYIFYIFNYKKKLNFWEV